MLSACCCLCALSAFAVRGCPDVPVPKLNANNFSVECAGQPHGGQCTAICFDNAFGGWTATCNANSGWVYTGGCPRECLQICFIMIVMLRIKP